MKNWSWVTGICEQTEYKAIAGKPRKGNKAAIWPASDFEEVNFSVREQFRYGIFNVILDQLPVV